MNILFDISMIGLGYQSGSAAQGGLYRVVDHLARGLARSKECHVFYSALARADLINPCFRYFEQFAETKHVPLVYFREINFLLCRTANILLKQLPPKACISSRNGKRLIHVIKTILQKSHHLEGRLTQKQLAQVDIIHTPVFNFPEFVFRCKRIKKAFTIHDLTPIKFSQNWKNERVIIPILKTWSSENWAFCVSESTRNDFCEYLKINASRTFVTPPAADPETFHPCTDKTILNRIRKKYGIPEGDYVLCLNTFSPHKNIDHLIRCFTRLVRQEKLTDLHLVLAGARGWKEENFLSALADSNLENRQIHRIGFVKDEQLAALYSGALFFAFMSEYEGFGLPPLEAMQCGVPVITSNIASLPEVVGDAGIMLDPGDTDGLCGEMLKLYRDDTLRKTLSLRSLQRAKLFSWEKTVQKTIDGYRTILDS